MGVLETLVLCFLSESEQQQHGRGLHIGSRACSWSRGLHAQRGACSKEEMGTPISSKNASSQFNRQAGSHHLCKTWAQLP